jgi:hypothetical protein
MDTLLYRTVRKQNGEYISVHASQRYIGVHKLLDPTGNVSDDAVCRLIPERLANRPQPPKAYKHHGVTILSRVANDQLAKAIFQERSIR